MKRINLIFALVALMCCPLSLSASTSTTVIALGDSEEMTLSEIIALGLPVLYVETVDHEEPTCDYVTAPPGAMSSSIANATKVHGRLIVYNRIADVDSVMYDSGEFEEDVSGMTIKIRGNKSAYDVKKPYKIKLQKKFDLMFGGNDAVYKDKEWLLLRDDFMTTIRGLKVNEVVGMTWTPRHRFVNLIINNRYRGAYLLCESIKRNPDCRLNVDKNCGYIFEFDPYWWNEPVYVKSSRYPSYSYTFKYPDDEDITEDQLAYMLSLVTAYERSLQNGTYTDYIDVKSFAGWCLIHDILGTKDAGGTNMFYTKYDTTFASKMVMPLAWDFDMAYRTPSAWSASHIEHMTKLFNSSNRTFTGEYAALWRRIRFTFIYDVNSAMTAFSKSAEGMALDASFALDQILYNRTTSVNTQINGGNSWITSRYSWLNNSIEAMCPRGDVNVDATVSIEDVTALIAMLLNGDTSKSYADVDMNGVVNISDVSYLVNMLLGN